MLVTPGVGQNMTDSHGGKIYFKGPAETLIIEVWN